MESAETPSTHLIQIRIVAFAELARIYNPIVQARNRYEFTVYSIAALHCNVN